MRNVLKDHSFRKAENLCPDHCACLGNPLGPLCMSQKEKELPSIFRKFKAKWALPEQGCSLLCWSIFKGPNEIPGAGPYPKKGVVSLTDWRDEVQTA